MSTEIRGQALTRPESGYSERQTIAVRQLRELAGRGPSGDSHIAADDLLLWLLADDEVTAAYEAIPKWFA